MLVLCSIWPPEDGHADRRAAGEVAALLDAQVADAASTLRTGAVTRHASACWLSEVCLPAAAAVPLGGVPSLLSPLSLRAGAGGCGRV